MPLVKITIQAGKSSDYRKALLNGVHVAMVQTIKIPGHDRFQMLYELNKDNFETPPNRTDNITIIEITMFKGRSVEAEKRLYHAIVDNFAKNP